MLAWHRTTALLVLASSWATAQLSIDNPRHLDLPEQQAQILFLTTMRVMEAEFRSPGALENKFYVKLVLGAKPDRFTIDDPEGNGTVYMEQWNEGKFAVVTMRLAVQHLLAPDRQKRLLDEIVRHTREIAPVSAARLAKEGAQPPPPSLSSTQESCVGGVANTPAAGRLCTALRPVPMR